MKPLVRGTQYAVTALMPQASLAAERILHDGGNAFDGIVAGQAVLGVVQPSANGLGSDAQLLIYDAKAKKVWSLNAEGTAPKLATIDWYKTHNGGKLPVDDGLLSGTVPGVVDAWYVMLSRWGTRSLAECLAQAIELARRDDKHRFVHAFPNVDNAPSNAICRKLGFELMEACEFEFPTGHWMTCNDWRLDLRV